MDAVTDWNEVREMTTKQGFAVDRQGKEHLSEKVASTDGGEKMTTGDACPHPRAVRWVEFNAPGGVRKHDRMFAGNREDIRSDGWYRITASRINPDSMNA